MIMGVLWIIYLILSYFNDIYIFFIKCDLIKLKKNVLKDFIVRRIFFCLFYLFVISNFVKSGNVILK